VPIHLGQGLLSPRVFLLTLVQPRSERVRTRHEILLPNFIFDQGGAFLTDGRVARINRCFVGLEACEAGCIIGILWDEADKVRARKFLENKHEKKRTSSEGGR
jgi:hypothetical protein